MIDCMKFMSVQTFCMHLENLDYSSQVIWAILWHYDALCPLWSLKVLAFIHYNYIEIEYEKKIIYIFSISVPFYVLQKKVMCFWNEMRVNKWWPTIHIEWSIPLNFKHLNVFMWYKLSVKAYFKFSTWCTKIKMRNHIDLKAIFETGLHIFPSKIIFLTLASQLFSLTWCNLHYYYFA